MSDLLPSIFNKNWFNLPSLLQDIKEFQNEGKGLTIYDEQNKIIVEAPMPGLKNEEIEINFHNGMLWIKGEKKEETTDKDKKFYTKSFRSYSFNVSLPDRVDETQDPNASYKDGVLKISFQKAKSSQNKRIPIKNEK